MLKVEKCGVRLRKLGKCRKITDSPLGFLWLLDECLEHSMYSVDTMGWQMHGASCREMDRWSLWVLLSLCDIHIVLCSQVKVTKKILGTFPEQCWQSLEKWACHVAQGLWEFLSVAHLECDGHFTAPYLKARLQKEVLPLPPSPSLFSSEEVLKCTTCSNFYKLKEKFFWFFKACKSNSNSKMMP